MSIAAFMTAYPLVAGAVSEGVQTANKIIAPLKATVNVAVAARNYQSQYSLIDAGKSSRVEPITVIGADIVTLDFLPDVLQSLQSIFSGYYLQAVAMTAQIGGVEAGRMLERYNPDREGKFLVDQYSGMEAFREHAISYKYRLPIMGNKKAVALENSRLALEGITDHKSKMDRMQEIEADQKFIHREQLHAENIKNIEAKRMLEAEYIELDKKHNERLEGSFNQNKALNDIKLKKEQLAFASKREEEINKLKEAKRNKTEPNSFSIGKDTVKQARELADLSVGKMITVQFGGGKDATGRDIPKVDIHIAIRLIVNSLPDSSLIPLLAGGTMDNTFIERWHAMRAGRIEFLRDLIFCQDLIDERKKAMITDTSGVHREIIRRANNAKVGGLVDQKFSYNVASNLYVISEVTAAVIERKVGGKLANPLVRKKIFESGYAMIIVVINRQWERVTFYHRGIAAATEVSLRDIKIGNKGSGPDVGDILKAYMAGNSPSL
jgi:hypothetical protein